LMVAMHGEDSSSVPDEEAEIAVWWDSDDAIVLDSAEKS
jgi:hypothetical protein